MKQTLQQYFGYSDFREGQEQVIGSLLDGRSAAAIFPTGSGKSLCYQLPALHFPHLTLVVSPLLALMKDQVAFLTAKGIPAASIDSSLKRDEVNTIMGQVKRGQLKILMVAVERLKNERFRHFIQSIPISLLVVDEAHCISEWGHNFRPDYLKLPQYVPAFNIPQVLLLTATATPQVISDMCQKFNIASDDVTVTGFYRKNLHLEVEGVSDKNKLMFLENWLFHHARFKPLYRGEQRDKKNRDAHIAPTIVYVTLQQTAEEVAAELVRMGFHAKAYHAGMDNEIRHIVQTEFMAGHVEIIVATIAFGMGVDKSDIRNVVHYDMPKSIENYSQEIGRAGRDGQASDCLLLANKENLSTLENFVYGDTPELESIQRVLAEINQETVDGQWHVQLYALSQLSNIRQLTLKTLLVYLEIKQIIQPVFAYFAEYKFKLNQPVEWIESQFEGERQTFVKAIFNHSKQARTWWTLDVESICLAYQTGDVQADRKRVVTAIEYFEQQNWLELQTSQMTEVFRVNVQNIDTNQMAAQLSQLFEQKEQAEIQRIQTMLDIFERPQCLSFQLASYYGDSHAPVHCGHCSVCSGKTVTLPKAPEIEGPDPSTVRTYIQQFSRRCEESAQVTPSSQLTTRFLCGISTPLFTKLKARSLSGFGQLQSYRYERVKQLVESLI